MRRKPFRVAGRVGAAGLGTRALMQRSGLPTLHRNRNLYSAMALYPGRTIRGIPSSQRKVRTVAIKVLTNWGRAHLWYAAKSLRRLLRVAPATSVISTVVDWCTRRAWVVLGLTMAIAAVSAIYAAERFAIKTDINPLISPDLPWAKRAARLDGPTTQSVIFARVI
jgi:hypothetical protein